MREPIRDKARLEHILQAIEKIEEYTRGLTKEKLSGDSLHLHATAYNIQIVGEAVYKLSQEFKEAHPETPWRMIEKMRISSFMIILLSTLISCGWSSRMISLY